MERAILEAVARADIIICSALPWVIAAICLTAGVMLYGRHHV